MKSVRLIICLLSLLISVTSWAQGRYAISRVEITAKVFADAGMSVSESRTYMFQDAFSFVSRSFPKNKSIRYRDFLVLENNIVYQQNNSNAPGSFRVEENDQQFNVVWCFNSRNESRTFTLEYRVDDVITRFQDVAVLDYQFIGHEWQKRQSNVQLTILPPEGLQADQVKEWVHGPLRVRSQIAAQGQIVVTASGVPIRTNLKVRAIYPRALFSAGPVIDKPVIASLLREEEKLAAANEEKRKKAQERQNIGKATPGWARRLSLALTVLAVILFGILIGRYGLHREKSPVHAHGSEKPQNTQSTLAGFLLNWRITTGNDLAATLGDLAQRGFLHMHEEKAACSDSAGQTRTRYRFQPNLPVWQERKAEIKGFEQSLLNFLFEKLYPEQNGLYLDQLRGNDRALRKFFAQWQKEVKTAAKEMNVWIVYESKLGNTAELAAQLNQAMVRSERICLLQADQARTPEDIDLLLIGVPGHRHSRPDAIFDWLQRIPPYALHGVRFSVFDVRLTPLRRFQTSSARKLGRAILRHGGRYASPPESFYLAGPEGPLAEGELQRALFWTYQMVQECGG